MCGICGCSEANHDHRDPGQRDHLTAHSHHDGAQGNLVQIERDIFDKNNQFAAQNRTYFSKKNTVAINLVSSPGSGKTTLLIKTIEALKDQVSIAVIEGDQQTQLDADRIRETRVSVLQINTGNMCHLDAH